VRQLRLLVLLLVVALTGIGCKALENDPVLGNKPFQPNMDPKQMG